MAGTNFEAEKHQQAHESLSIIDQILILVDG